MPQQIKRTGSIGLVVLGIAMIAVAGYSCGKRKNADQIAQLSTQLAASEKTVEIKDGLFATKIVEMENVQNLLDGSQKSIAGLKKQLSDSQAQLLTTQQIAIKWKGAYEAELTAHQSDGGVSDTPPPPGCPSAQRKRIEFDGDLGPISAKGFTITDPAEAHLKLEQIRPLVLTVSVAKNRDGTWQSYVTSSEPNMQAQVNLAGVDTGVISPTWRQRIWIDGGVNVLWGQSANLGVSYHWDRISMGTSCSVWTGGNGCGLTVGFRVFK